MISGGSIPAKYAHYPFVLTPNVILSGIEIKTFAPTLSLFDKSYSMALALNSESIGTATPHGRIYL
jgi:hypothetical protein